MYWALVKKENLALINKTIERVEKGELNSIAAKKIVKEATDKIFSQGEMNIKLLKFIQTLINDLIETNEN